MSSKPLSYPNLRAFWRSRLSLRRNASSTTKDSSLPQQPAATDSRNFPTRMRKRLKPIEEPVHAVKEAQSDAPSRFKRFRQRFRLRTIDHPTWRPIFIILRSVVISLPILGTLMLHFPVMPMHITGPSMRPTINPNSSSDDDDQDSTYTLVQRWNINDRTRILRGGTEGQVYKSRYDRGALVIYTVPHDPKKIGIKRIVGLPGDLVQPLPGYAGQDVPDSVVIPYNHVWLEGDAADRAQSLDSNYFGPISQSCIRGRVGLLWSPWWNIFRGVTDRSTTWPARSQNRVRENAVQSQQVNPDDLAEKLSLADSRGERLLRLLQSQPDKLVEQWTQQPECRDKYRAMWRNAKQTAKFGEHDTRVVALQIAQEFEKLIGRDQLVGEDTAKKRTRWTPSKPPAKESAFADAKIVADEERQRRRAEKELEEHDQERPAAAKLRELQQRTKEMKDEVERKMEERAEKDNLTE